MECTLHNVKQKVTYEGGRESNWRWWLPMCECTKVQCTIQRVQPDSVTTVEASTTRGMTALVYWQLNSSLYTGAVQGYWSTPNWSDRRQGCRQVSIMSSLMLMMMTRWEPVCHRTVRQQHWVLRKSSSGLSLFSFPLISAVLWGGGQGIDSQRFTYRQSWLSFHSHLNLHTAEQGLGKLHNYFTTG